MPVQDIPAERRKDLIALLTSPMRQDFKWNFGVLLHPGKCGTVGCALGLYGYTHGIIMDMSIADEHFGMTPGRAEKVFLFHHGAYMVESPHDVTPAMVANMVRKSKYTRNRP